MLWSIAFIVLIPLPGILILKHNWLKRFGKFLENNPLISIGIESSDDGNEFLVACKVSMSSLKCLYVSVVEESLVCNVNCVEYLKDVPVMSVQKVLLHQFEFNMHV